VKRARLAAAAAALATLATSANLLRAPAALAAGPPRSLADTLAGDAKRDYETGKLLASDGDYTGAALKFQSAYDASRDARLLWNVAFCEKQLRHYARVLALLRRFEAEGGPLLTAKDRRDAHDLATALQPFTTTVKIEVNEGGAEVFVDDERVGVSPLATPYVVDIGMHRVRATKAGFVDAAVTVPVGGGVDLPIALRLEKDVREGRVVVHAPAGASIVLDDRRVGASDADLVVPSGGHQLRVEAPGMRAYRSEIVVADRETRTLEIMLERLPDAELPRLQVAVGCVDRAPRAAADGLVVTLDGASTAAAPIETRTQGDPERGGDVVAWVAYAVAPGAHLVDVRAPGCVPAQLRVTVADARGARIEGVLRPQPAPLAEGAAGSPDGWRLTAGAWTGALVQDDLFGDVFGGTPVGVPVRPRGLVLLAAGPAIEAGWTARWLTAVAQTSVAWASSWGTTPGLPQPNGVPYAAAAESTGADLTSVRLAVRAGPRLPLGWVALSGGATGGVALETVRSAQGASVTHSGALGGVWAALDVKPLCDWTTTLAAHDDLASGAGYRTMGVAMLAGYEPNARCRHGRATRYGVEERALP